MTASAPTAGQRPAALTVRPMTHADLGAVLRIDEQSYSSPWSAVYWKQLLDHGPTRILRVALADGIVVGHAVLFVLHDEGHVASVAVHPDHRRSGVGSVLVEQLCHAAVAAGCEAMTLEVRVSNTSAQALYRRFGFAPAGVRKNYYADAGEDALIMWAHDVGGEDFGARLDRVAVKGRP